jgi:hypothetical protein
VRGAELIEALPALDGKIVTADARYCLKTPARVIVEKGGDHLSPIKANQPGLLAQAQVFVALPDPLLVPSTDSVMAASRPAPCAPSPSNPTRQRSFSPAP